MPSISASEAHGRQKSIRTAGLKSSSRGWNSWLTYGFSVTEQELLHESESMSRLLGGAGFDTLVVDAQWYVDFPARARAGHPDPEVRPNLDEFGRFMPSPHRFPSTCGSSFRPLADRLAQAGQYLGVHLMRGIPRAAVAADSRVFGSRYTASQIADRESACTWNLEMHGLKPDHPGSREYYRSVIQLIAEWGIRYIKYDDLGSPYHQWDIATLRESIDDLAPHLRFSLSPGPVPPENVFHAREHTDSYRVGPDLWDRWKDVAYNAKAVADIRINATEGLPDLDMLPIGRIGKRAEVGIDRLSSLSPAEVETMVVWCSFVKSPLILGGEIDTISEPELAVLSSDLLRRIHQTPFPVTTQTISEGVLLARTEVEGVTFAVCANVGDEIWCGEVPCGIGQIRMHPHSHSLYRLDPSPLPVSFREEA